MPELYERLGKLLDMIDKHIARVYMRTDPELLDISVREDFYLHSLYVRADDIVVKIRHETPAV